MGSGSEHSRTPTDIEVKPSTWTLPGPFMKKVLNPSSKL